MPLIEEEQQLKGIEAFSDASIRIYRYDKGFDLPLSYARAIKAVHTHSTNSIAQYFTSDQLSAWQGITDINFTGLVKQFHRTYLMFDECEEIIGYALLSVAGFIQHFFIHPDHQYKGIGKRLLAVIEQNPSNWNKDGKIELNGNNASYQFYLKQGYSIIKEHELDMRGSIMPVKLMLKSILWEKMC